MRARGRWGPIALLCLLVAVFITRVELAANPFPFLRQTSSLPVPVVVVVLDELPVASLMDGLGRVDAATFPNFGRLARRSTWYRMQRQRRS